MNRTLRTSALGALLAVGLASNSAYATSTMASGVPASSLNTVTFTLSAVTGPTFSVYFSNGPSQFAPLSLSLLNGTTPVTALPSTTGGISTLSFRSLSAGTYSLVFTPPSFAPSGSTFTVFTSLDSGFNVISVPEPESIALALAGVGLVGTLVSRRRSSSR
jgi:PEP-CTERM motif